MDKIIYTLLGALPTGTIITYIFLKYPERVEKWIGMISGFLSYIWKRSEYFSTKREIQGKVNSFVRSLETQTTVTFPRVILRWTMKDENEDIVYEDYEAVLVIRDRKHKNKNFIHAAYFFVSETLLKKSKKHLSKSQKRALDLFATKCVMEKESRAALEQFINDYFSPEIEASNNVRSYIKQFVNIDRIGVFFPILIQELDYLGNKIFLEKPTEDVVKEIKGLIDFLERFSKRNVGDNTTPELYTGIYTKCAIKIVAGRITRESGNINSHKNRICQFFRQGCENVYIIGSSEKDNINFMKQVSEAVMFDDENFQLIKETVFRGSITIQEKIIKVETYFIHLHNPKVVEHIRR